MTPLPKKILVIEDEPDMARGLCDALTFEVVDGRIVDQGTGSVWNVLGQAVEGELSGQELTPVVSINHFWFSWAAFRPETRVYKP